VEAKIGQAQRVAKLEAIATRRARFIHSADRTSEVKIFGQLHPSAASLNKVLVETCAEPLRGECGIIKASLFFFGVEKLSGVARGLFPKFSGFCNVMRKLAAHITLACEFRQVDKTPKDLCMIPRFVRPSYNAKSPA